MGKNGSQSLFTAKMAGVFIAGVVVLVGYAGLESGALGGGARKVRWANKEGSVAKAVVVSRPRDQAENVAQTSFPAPVTMSAPPLSAPPQQALPQSQPAAEPVRAIAQVDPRASETPVVSAAMPAPKPFQMPHLAAVSSKYHFDVKGSVSMTQSRFEAPQKQAAAPPATAGAQVSAATPISAAAPAAPTSSARPKIVSKPMAASGARTGSGRAIAAKNRPYALNFLPLDGSLAVADDDQTPRAPGGPQIRANTQQSVTVTRIGGGGGSSKAPSSSSKGGGNGAGLDANVAQCVGWRLHNTFGKCYPDQASCEKKEGGACDESISAAAKCSDPDGCKAKFKKNDGSVGIAYPTKAQCQENEKTDCVSQFSSNLGKTMFVPSK